MRWSQGAWSEERVVSAVNATGQYFALPYGPSGVAPDDDPRKFEQYFERLEAAGLTGVKRPDILVFKAADQAIIETLVSNLGGIQELPFTTEGALTELLNRAVVAVECENSLWVASQMPAFGTQLSPQRRKGGALGMKKAAVLPTVILKEEDRGPLKQWQAANRIPIHIWHVFFDLAYGISLDDAERRISSSDIEPTDQVFQAPSGATTTKVIYKIYYHYAYPLGRSTAAPELKAAFIQDKNGHILPYVKFEGGALELTKEAIRLLESLSAAKGPEVSNAQ